MSAIDTTDTTTMTLQMLQKTSEGTQRISTACSVVFMFISPVYNACSDSANPMFSTECVLSFSPGGPILVSLVSPIVSLRVRATRVAGSRTSHRDHIALPP